MLKITQIIPKKLLNLLLVVLSFSGVFGQSQHAKNDLLDASISTDFTPAFYNHKATYHLDADPDTVFPFFEPQWRCLWRPSWNQVSIFRRSKNDIGWGVDRVLPHHAQGPEIFVIVTHLDKVKREIQYTIVWGGWEIQKFEIICTANPSGGTDTTIRTMTYGLNDFGKRDVIHYCEGGHEDKQNLAYVDAIGRYLAKNAGQHDPQKE